MIKQVKKAIFPIAGLGTRFLPATKSIPKEMLIILDRPILEWAVIEASLSGIEENDICDIFKKKFNNRAF